MRIPLFIVWLSSLSICINIICLLMWPFIYHLAQVIYCFQYWFYFCNLVLLLSYYFGLPLFKKNSYFLSCLYLKQVFSTLLKYQHIWGEKVFFLALGFVFVLFFLFFFSFLRSMLILNTKRSILIVWGRQLVFEGLHQFPHNWPDCCLLDLKLELGC